MSLSPFYAMALSVLRFTAADYLCGISKHFLIIEDQDVNNVGVTFNVSRDHDIQVTIRRV